MQKIPNGATDIVGSGCVTTRDTKEAALLYSLNCKPFMHGENPSARWESGGGQKKVLWFFFLDKELTKKIHIAFQDNGYSEKYVGASIPDEHMPAVIALVKNIFHNWERLAEVTRIGPTNELPLHYRIVKDGKMYVTTKREVAA